jgi:hypothetical protein
MFKCKLKGFSDVRASFHWHFLKKREKGLHQENNGILGSQHIDRTVDF